MALKITDVNFEDLVLASKKPVVVNFTAAWCGPCRMIAPMLGELNTQFGDKIVIGDVNVDSDQKDAAKLGVRNIPTVIMFQNGKETFRFVGIAPKENYVDAINKSLGIALPPVQENKWNAAMVSVNSSNLAEIGHQEKFGPNGEGVLRVKFHRGPSYEYWPVTKEEYLQGLRAEKIFDWFNSEIKPKTYRKVE